MDEPRAWEKSALARIEGLSKRKHRAESTLFATQAKGQLWSPQDNRGDAGLSHRERSRTMGLLPRFSTAGPSQASSSSASISLELASFESCSDERRS